MSKKQNYKSNSELFLQVVNNERSIEFQRANLLDTKATTIISLIVVFITIFIPLIPFEKLKSMYLKINGFSISVWLTITVLLISIAGVIYSIYKLFKVIKAYNYTGFNIDFCLDSNWKEKENIVKKSVINQYREIIKAYRKVNDKKAHLYAISLRICVLSIFLMILSVVILLIICV